MKRQHTPGPWTAQTYPDLGRVCIEDSGPVALVEDDAGALDMLEPRMIEFVVPAERGELEPDAGKDGK